MTSNIWKYAWAAVMCTLFFFGDQFCCNGEYLLSILPITLSASWIKASQAAGFNIEIKNRWNKSLSSTLTFLDLSIDKGVSLGGPVGVEGNIDAQVGVFEVNAKDSKNRNNRFVLQHLWTKDDRKEWLGLVYEIGLNNNISLFISDIWNYGNSEKLHYYNLGGSYSKGGARLSANYGRQRGGLVCVGGVCRFVPESNGFNLNLSYSF